MALGIGITNYETMNTINHYWGVKAAAYVGSNRHLKRVSSYYAAGSSTGCGRHCDDSRSGECTSRDSRGLQKNPEKIAFAVSSRKILSFFATCDGLNSFSRFLGTKKPKPSAYSQRTRRRVSAAIRSFCGISNPFELARHARRGVTILKNNVKKYWGRYG